MKTNSFENGLSDHTIIKIIYRNFKQYDNDQFNVPMKAKFWRGNQNTHFNKNLREQIMIRSRLKNKANKSKKFYWHCQV